ncbi:MAG: TIR domain-containing protein [Verrucomicrobiaceae bacterium]|nr:TIR domain-containing protein [Verrucomicrobiaceae bacterium]
MPSIFISYSHDPNEPGHGEKVAGLVASLLDSGLKVYFDQNRGDDEEGVPWPIWMESKIEAADFVLLVCTKLYLDKVQQRVDASEGFGVLWEANLIYNYLYVAKLNTTKFLPVLFSSEDRKFIPRPLVGANSFVVVSDSAYTQLYAFLTGQHRANFPAQGPATAVLPKKTILPLFSIVGRQDSALPMRPAPVDVPSFTAATFVLKADIPPKPRQDIRGLDWYEECDAQHFLGREEDTNRLLAMLLSQSVIRLIGPSGVGKSSLIRAGLLPKIREFGWRACVLRPFEDPARRVPEQLTEFLLAPGTSFSTPLDPVSLRRELSRALSAEGTKRLVLLLDQFEDIVSPSAAPDAIDSMRLWLRELWEQAETTPFLRVIVVYRTDADARLGRLWQEITGRSEGLPYLPVEGLSQEVAEKIIRQASRERGWQIETSLPEITRQLATESQKLGCSGDVFPVYLQILLKQVSESSEGRLTRELIESLGGVAGLIGRFLEQSLARLNARGGDWQYCGRVLEALSRSSGTKSALSLDDLTRECGLSRTGLLPESRTVVKCSSGSETRRTEHHEKEQTQ